MQGHHSRTHSLQINQHSNNMFMYFWVTWAWCVTWPLIQHEQGLKEDWFHWFLLSHYTQATPSIKAHPRNPCFQVCCDLMILDTDPRWLNMLLKGSWETFPTVVCRILFTLGAWHHDVIESPTHDAQVPAHTRTLLLWRLETDTAGLLHSEWTTDW